MTLTLYWLTFLALCGAMMFAALGWRFLQPSGTPGLWRFFARPFARRLEPKGVKLDRLTAFLRQAGRDGASEVERFLEERVVGAVLGTGLGALLAHLIGGDVGLFAMGLFATAGVVVPQRVVRARAQKRREAIATSFPGSVDLIMTALDAGLSMEQAIARVAERSRQAIPVLAYELSVTAQECEAGVPLTEALRRLAYRVELEEVTSFCSVVAQAQELGAPIVQTLAEHADWMRQLRMAQLEEYAGKLVVKLTLPLILCLLPAAMLAILGPVALQLARAMSI